MDPRRLRTGEWIAALGGALLLISLFLTWYDGGVTGWEALSVADVLLALIALLAISLVPVTASQRVPALPLALDAWVAIAGKVAVLIVLFRLLSPPGDAELAGAGAWLALGASVVTIAGGWIAMRDERLSPEDRPTDLTGKPIARRREVELHPAP